MAQTTRKYEEFPTFLSTYAVAVANNLTVDQAHDLIGSATFAAMKTTATDMVRAMSQEQRDAFKEDAQHAFNEWIALHRINWSVNDPDPDQYIADHRRNYPGDWWKPIYTAEASN